jgi:hypothetical protein
VPPAFNAPVCGVLGVSLAEELLCAPAGLASVFLPVRLKAGKQGIKEAYFSTVWNEEIPKLQFLEFHRSNV